MNFYHLKPSSMSVWVQPYEETDPFPVYEKKAHKTFPLQLVGGVGRRLPKSESTSNLHHASLEQ